MATRAEQFRSEVLRSRQHQNPKKKLAPKRRPVDDDGARNLDSRAAKKATVVTEESHSGRPSRKSGRTSSNRGKNSDVLEYVARVRSAMPQARHARRS